MKIKFLLLTLAVGGFLALASGCKKEADMSTTAPADTNAPASTSTNAPASTNTVK